jgi:hypothetical protein
MRHGILLTLQGSGNEIFNNNDGMQPRSNRVFCLSSLCALCGGFANHNQSHSHRVYVLTKPSHSAGFFHAIIFALTEATW